MQEQATAGTKVATRCDFMMLEEKKCEVSAKPYSLHHKNLSQNEVAANCLTVFWSSDQMITSSFVTLEMQEEVQGAVFVHLAHNK